MDQKNPCKAKFQLQCQYIEKLFLDGLMYPAPEPETCEYSKIMR